jgi:hypothetical protein
MVLSVFSLELCKFSIIINIFLLFIFYLWQNTVLSISYILRACV